MEFIKSACKKCGYEIIMPEKSESIVCGSCGGVNNFSKLSSILKKYNDTLDPPNYRESSWESKTSHRENVPSGMERADEAELPSIDDEEDISPEAKKVSKVMTLLFILAPFIALIIDYFKLPSYTALLIIVFIIGVLYFLRRK